MMMRELQRHVDAFELYFQFKQSGKTTAEAISLVAVEQQFSETSIYKWKRAFNWDDREAIRGREIQKNVEKRTNSNIVDNKFKYLSIVHNIFANYRDDVKNGKRLPIEINNPRDLDIVVKLALLLQGESTDRTEQNGQIQHEMSIHDRIKERAEYYRQIK